MEKLKAIFSVRGPMLEQGHSVRSPLPQEERMAEAMYDELTTIPIS